MNRSRRCIRVLIRFGHDRIEWFYVHYVRPDRKMNGIRSILDIE